ncbi:MAG: ornithine cyclodeaminase family protein [Pseudomonadales bacterium]|nr:ornithine cyclodeaminase family protein [Pseudomonadales bacterium]
MIVLTHSDLEQVLTTDTCRAAMAGAMRATSARNCVLPLRQFMPIPERPGKLGLMPGYLGAEGDVPARFGVKIVSKYERPPGDPHGTHVGAVMLFDGAQGLPLALFEGGTLTAIRTAATTALATEMLARADARHLLIVGAGEEARYHIRALLRVRPFELLTVWARRPERAADMLSALQLPSTLKQAVAADLSSSVGEADVICTVTSAKEPILRGEWLPGGVHLNLVGSAIPTTAEVDSIGVARGRFFVDYIDAAKAQAGELLAAIRTGAVTEDHIAGEIGDVLLGRKPGRESPTEITIYKSLGVTTQDLAAAELAYRLACERGIGQQIDLGA